VSVCFGPKYLTHTNKVHPHTQSGSNYTHTHIRANTFSLFTKHSAQKPAEDKGYYKLRSKFSLFFLFFVSCFVSFSLVAHPRVCVCVFDSAAVCVRVGVCNLVCYCCCFCCCLFTLVSIFWSTVPSPPSLATLRVIIILAVYFPLLCKLNSISLFMCLHTCST